MTYHSTRTCICTYFHGLCIYLWHVCRWFTYVVCVQVLPTGWCSGLLSETLTWPTRGFAGGSSASWLPWRQSINFRYELPVTTVCLLSASQRRCWFYYRVTQARCSAVPSIGTACSQPVEKAPSISGICVRETLSPSLPAIRFAVWFCAQTKTWHLWGCIEVEARWSPDRGTALHLIAWFGGILNQDATTPNCDFQFG